MAERYPLSDSDLSICPGTEDMETPSMGIDPKIAVFPTPDRNRETGATQLRPDGRERSTGSATTADGPAEISLWDEYSAREHDMPARRQRHRAATT